MAESLLENYNPLYDVHLRQYFALPHMQKHLRRMGLIDSNGKMRDGQDAVYARHNMMMDMMLKNREQQLMKLAELQKKLDAAEKVEIYRRIRSGQSPDSFRRTKASRSLSRGRAREGSGSRQRRFSNSWEDKELITKIESKDEPEKINERDPYARLSAKASKYRYLHKLDDKTLVDYQDQLKRELDRLERFREVSFGVHSVARHPPSSAQSWFFRRRSLPSLTQSAPAAALHEPLRSVNSLRGRKANASPRRTANDSCPPTVRQRRTSNSANPRLPPIQRKHVSKSAAAAPTTKTSAKPLKLPPAQPRSAPKPSTKGRSSTTKASKREKLPVLEAVGVGIGVAAIGASAAALSRKKSEPGDISGAPLASPVPAESEHSEEPTTEDEHCNFYDNGHSIRPESNATNGTSETGGADEPENARERTPEPEEPEEEEVATPRSPHQIMKRTPTPQRFEEEQVEHEFHHQEAEEPVQDEDHIAEPEDFGEHKSPTPATSPVQHVHDHVEEVQYGEREAEGEPYDEEHHHVHKRVLNEEDYRQEEEIEHHEQHHAPVARSPEHEAEAFEHHDIVARTPDRESHSLVEQDLHGHENAPESPDAPVEKHFEVHHHSPVARSPEQEEHQEHFEVRHSPVEEAYQRESPVDQEGPVHHSPARSPFEPQEEHSEVRHSPARSPIEQDEHFPHQGHEIHHSPARSPVEHEEPEIHHSPVARSPVEPQEEHSDVRHSPARSPIEQDEHFSHQEHEIHHSPARSPVEHEHHARESPIEHQEHPVQHSPLAHSPPASPRQESERGSPAREPQDEPFEVQHHSHDQGAEAFEHHDLVARSPDREGDFEPMTTSVHEHFDHHEERESPDQPIPIGAVIDEAIAEVSADHREHHEEHRGSPVGHQYQDRPDSSENQQYYQDEPAVSPIHGHAQEEKELSPAASPVQHFDHHFEEQRQEHHQGFDHESHHEDENLEIHHEDRHRRALDENEYPEDDHRDIHQSEPIGEEAIVDSHSYSPVEQPHLEVEPEVAEHVERADFSEEFQEEHPNLIHHQPQEDIGDHMKPASPSAPNSPDRRSVENHETQPIDDHVCSIVDTQPEHDDLSDQEDISGRSPMELDYANERQEGHHHLDDHHEIREEYASPMSQGNDEESYHHGGMGLGVPEILETAASERGVGSDDNLSTDSMIIHPDHEEKDEKPIGDEHHHLETQKEETVEGSSDENGNRNGMESHKEYPDGTHVFEQDYEDENGAHVHKKVVHSEHSDDNGHYYSHHEQSEVHSRLIHAGSKTPGSEHPANDSPRMSPTVEQSTL